MKPVCLVTATPMELKPVAQRLGLAAALVPQWGQWKPAEAGDRELILLTTGVGPVNAALALGRLLGAKDVAGVVNLGIAGSFDLGKAGLLDAVAATAEIWPEFGVRFDHGVEPQELGLPQWKGPGGVVRDRLELDPEHAAAAMGLALGQELLRGTAVTVAGVTADAALTERLRSGGALTESMEGFALALGCVQADVPFLEVRIVSNPVGSRKPDAWDLQGAVRKTGDVVAQLFSVG